MKNSNDLRQLLRAIDRKSYPAYKDTKGGYQFQNYQLWIDHVQGDPFASPSRLRVVVGGKAASFPGQLYDTYEKRVALQDYLLRLFKKAVDQFSREAKGNGKSGLMAVSRCGQEILERTSCQIDCGDGSVTVRLEVGFPAFGRTINSGELEKILFDFLPRCVNMALLYPKYDSQKKNETEAVRKLAEDQTALRAAIRARDLVAFVANRSILPRESGVSAKPLRDAVYFQSPSSMEVSIDLPNYGTITGMGIKKGVTLIVGGGYHGKSTLLEALELGVYNHIAGDGREYVVTDETAVKLRAEDGRSVKNVNISMFINGLPNGKDTKKFCTENASGSTSQAANVVEGIEAGAKLFLIDEDTSATNFMIRDELMQRVVKRSQEPIIPFIERVRELYESFGVSTILVAGSSGAYFHVADQIIQMERYIPEDITQKAKQEASQFPAIKIQTESPMAFSFDRAPVTSRVFKNSDRLKIRTSGRDSVSIDHEVIDLRYVEQLVDTEQLNALGYLLKYAEINLMDGKRKIGDIVDALFKLIEKEGLDSVNKDKLALPRRQEIFACVNRYRDLLFR